MLSLTLIHSWVSGGLLATGTRYCCSVVWFMRIQPQGQESPREGLSSRCHVCREAMALLEICSSSNLTTKTKYELNLCSQGTGCPRLFTIALQMGDLPKAGKKDSLSLPGRRPKAVQSTAI